MQDLAPCPWCLTNLDLDVVELHDRPTDAFVVACGECGVIGPEGINAEEAMRKWDDRKVLAS